MVFVLIFTGFHLHYGDLTDSSCLVKLISEVCAVQVPHRFVWTPCTLALGSNCSLFRCKAAKT